MRRVPRAALILALSLLLLSSVGCGPGYKLAPVSGKVTMDNKPLVGAEVSFYPVNAGKDAPYASGKTDEQGNFKLETFHGKSTAAGAVVGENKVSISLIKLNSEKKNVMATLRGNPETLPARYNADSTLSFTVPADGSKDANFKLTSQ
jgi:hypothetical protein